MYCTNCGTELRDDANFCPNCGWSVPQKSKGRGGTTGNLPNSIAPSNVSAVGTAPAEHGRARHRATRIRVAVACVLLASLAVAGSLFYMRSAASVGGNSDTSQSDEKTSLTPQPVTVTINAPGYSASATRIPLHITGTDLEGAKVDATEYVGIDDANIQLNPGTYQIGVLASPILEDGSIYQVPDDPIELSVPDPSDNESDTSASGGAAETSSDSNAASISITLEPITNPLMVTDEQIKASRDAAASDPSDNGKAAELAKVASDTHETVKERSQLAIEFVKATQSAQEPFPDDDLDITTVDGTVWRENVLSYLEPGTSVYDSYDTFGIMAVTIVRNPQVTSVEGDAYTVSYQEAGTQNAIPGWSKRFKDYAVKLTFNSENKIISEDIVS